MFQDRRDAGRQLARLLTDEVTATGPPVIVGLARGGLPVAAEAADALAAPLDVLVARKLGVPWQLELGMGAIAEGGGMVLNEALIAEVGLDASGVAAVRVREQQELERRVRRYRAGRSPVPVAGRTVILVDDGLATGYTAWAAILALRARGASRVVLAVPVAPRNSVRLLSAVADRVVSVAQPDPFMAIGQFYDDFSQTSDEEVGRILSAPRPPAWCGGPPRGWRR